MVIIPRLDRKVIFRVALKRYDYFDLTDIYEVERSGHLGRFFQCHS